MEDAGHKFDGPVMGNGVMERAPKAVGEPIDIVFIPAIPVAVEAYMVPLGALVVSGCTCNPVITNWSDLLVLFTSIKTVIEVGPTVPNTDTFCMFLPAVQVKVGVVLQNCHPVGACKISVSVIIDVPPPPVRSELFVSATVMLPSVVHPGALPVTALLLQILVPPVAAVTVTRAKEGLARMHNSRARRVTLAFKKR
jgi:hypothetical protein